MQDSGMTLDKNEKETVAFKLMTLRRNGTLGSLFINRKAVIPVGIWMEAHDYPTKGYARRPGWHVTVQRFAPHLSTKGRVWVKVLIRDYEEIVRPKSQGGIWWLSKWMKVIRIENGEYLNHNTKTIMIDNEACEIDEEIVGLIEDLNKVGLKTKFCCQGEAEGYRNLDNGGIIPYVAFVNSEDALFRVDRTITDFSKETNSNVYVDISYSVIDGVRCDSVFGVYFMDGKPKIAEFHEYIKGRLHSI